jgi:hypothetical protein
MAAMLSEKREGIWEGCVLYITIDVHYCSALTMGGVQYRQDPTAGT